MSEFLLAENLANVCDDEAQKAELYQEEGSRVARHLNSHRRHWSNMEWIGQNRRIVTAIGILLFAAFMICLWREPNPSSWMIQAGNFLTIVCGTFISEDATSITTGLMIGAGKLSPASGLLACFIGIFVGDFGLWYIGHQLRKVARRDGLAATEKRFWWLPGGITRDVSPFAAWLDRKGWIAILAARCLPGSRFPMYVAAGWSGWQPAKFAFWTLIGGAIWTPTIVLVVAWLGSSATEQLEYLVHSTIWSVLLIGGLLWATIWGIGKIAKRTEFPV